jgi:hypothetical protein
MTYEGEISEYDVRIDKISAGDFVQLEKPMSGERYATDQFVATGLEDGGYVTVSIAADETLGKIIASETATEFVYNGTITENGHTLAIIEVL